MVVIARRARLRNGAFTQTFAKFVMGAGGIFATIKKERKVILGKPVECKRCVPKDAMAASPRADLQNCSNSNLSFLSTTPPVFVVLLHPSLLSACSHQPFPPRFFFVPFSVSMPQRSCFRFETHTHTYFRVGIGKSRKPLEKNGWPEGRQACAHTHTHTHTPDD